MTICRFGKAVEHAAEHHAQHVHPGLDVPAPARAGEHLGDERREAAERGVDHRLWRPRRVQVDRDAELFRAFQDRPVEFVVEIAAAVVAVDDRAGKFLLADAPLQFLRRLVGRRRRQRGEAADAGRMPLHAVGEVVVGVARHRDRIGGFHLLDAGRGERDHLHVDAGSVHQRDAPGADVAEFADEPGHTVAGVPALLLHPVQRSVDEGRRGKVFFQRNRAHCRSFHCRFRPAGV